MMIRLEYLKAFKDYMDEYERLFNMTLDETGLMIILYLAVGKKLSTKDLSSAKGWIPSRTSKVLKSLVKKGYVKRELGETDKRRMYFSLTSDGRNYLENTDFKKHPLPENIIKLEEELKLVDEGIIR